MKAYGFVFAILSIATASPARAADLSDAATTGSVQQLQTLGKKVPQPVGSPQQTPGRILGYQEDEDEDGMMGTYQPNGDTPTAPSSFFDSLGTNQRTCFTCHQPNSGWALSAESATERFT